MGSIKFSKENIRTLIFNAYKLGYTCGRADLRNDTGYKPDTLDGATTVALDDIIRFSGIDDKLAHSLEIMTNNAYSSGYGTGRYDESIGLNDNFKNIPDYARDMLENFCAYVCGDTEVVK